MRDEIKNFSPTPADLDYPDIIIGNNTSKNTSGSAGGKDTEPVNKQSRPRSMYSTWYPPVEKTLRLLSMLYRCVGGQVGRSLTCNRGKHVTVEIHESSISKDKQWVGMDTGVCWDCPRGCCNVRRMPASG